MNLPDIDFYIGIKTLLENSLGNGGVKDGKWTAAVFERKNGYSKATFADILYSFNVHGHGKNVEGLTWVSVYALATKYRTEINTILEVLITLKVVKKVQDQDIFLNLRTMRVLSR